MKFLNWVKGTFEENENGNNKPSSRRITAFWFVSLCTLIVVSIVIIAFMQATGHKEVLQGMIEATDILILALQICSAMVLLLFGVVTFPQIIQAWKGIDINKDDTKDKG